MNSTKFILVLSSTGVVLGFLKGVSWSKNRFYMTEKETEARLYATPKARKSDVKRLNLIFGGQGFRFM